MGIDSLTKAANAAGYAMATPEDEGELQAIPTRAREPSRSLVVAAPRHATPFRDFLQSAGATLRGYIGAPGGRAPA